MATGKLEAQKAAAKAREVAQAMAGPAPFNPNPQAGEIIDALGQQVAQLQFQLTIANLSNQKLRLRLQELEAEEE